MAVNVGNELTVTIAVVRHPLLSVYVIVVLPTAVPVTNPVELTVALASVDDVHGVVADAVADPVNGVVEPTQTVNVPDIVGKAFIVTLKVSSSEQPPGVDA